MSFCAFLKALDRTADTGCGFLTGISDGRSRASDLESTIGKLQSERERDRDALTDAEKRSRALEAKISKLNDDVTRRVSRCWLRCSPLSAAPRARAHRRRGLHSMRFALATC